LKHFGSGTCSIPDKVLAAITQNLLKSEVADLYKTENTRMTSRIITHWLPKNIIIVSALLLTALHLKKLSKLQMQ
jgi:hypothetical protein